MCGFFVCLRAFLTTLVASRCGHACGFGCKNGVKDGAESDVDCGGTCGACVNGGTCTKAVDCQTGFCGANVCQQLPTGGAITISSGFRIHTFTTGTADFQSFGPLAVELLIVGGGGGGGGGAGGFLTGMAPLLAGTFPVTVGTGGAVRWRGDHGIGISRWRPHRQ